MQPWQLGASEVATELSRGTLSVTELVESLLSRIDALDPSLNIWVTVDRDGALATAEKLDAVAPEARVGPLFGLPIGLKDIIYTAGLRTTASSKSLSDFVPDYDATVVTKLHEADSVVLGKLETCEFANGDPSVTVNPWNAEHTPGGSSSGSAVAVAAGTVPVSLGSQTGGSTLRPAAYNGVVGLKPTYGLVSNHGVIPLSWSFDHIGVFGRSVADTELVLRAIAGYDEADPASVHGRSDSLLDAGVVPPRPPVIGLIRSYFLQSCDHETLDSVEAVAARLEAAGAKVREVDLPGDFEEIASAYLEAMGAETAAYHEDHFARAGELYGPRIAAMVEQGLTVPAVSYIRAQRTRTLLVRKLERRLDAAGVDIFLTPVAPTPAPRGLATTGDPAFLVPWSFSGHPTIALPTGLSHYGLPMGVQLVGRRWHDADLLGAARWVESVLAFSEHPPCW